MTDEQLFLFVFFIFYLAESILWISRNQVAFIDIGLKKFALQYPNNFIGNTKGGLILTNPFLPSGLVFLSESFPFSMDENAIYPLSRDNLNSSPEITKQEKELIYWHNIDSINNYGNEIHINDTLFTKTPSTEIAENRVRTIKKICAAPKQKRNSIIKKEIEKSFDLNKIVKQKTVFSHISQPLRILCSLLTAYVFLIAPLLTFLYGLINMIIYIFFVYIFIHLLTLFVFIITKKKSLLHFSKSEFISIIIKVSLFPPALMRVNDFLSVKVLVQFHPIAVGSQLLSTGKFKSMAKKWLLKMYYPLKAIHINEDKQNVILNFNRIQLQCIESCLNNCHLDIPELIKPNFSDDPNLKSYCPRCQTEYYVEKGFCSDCLDIELIPVDHNRINTNDQ